MQNSENEGERTDDHEKYVGYGTSPGDKQTLIVMTKCAETSREFSSLYLTLKTLYSSQCQHDCYYGIINHFWNLGMDHVHVIILHPMKLMIMTTS